jgi:hypothetical protein
LRTELTTVNNPIPQLNICFLQIIINNDLIVGRRLLCILKLVLSLVESFLERFFGFGATATEALLQHLERRRRKEQETL